MLKKKAVQLPEEPDFSSLDAAVSELSKQTAALLGNNGEKIKVASKPTLPKKRNHLANKGKSFDIIHNAKKKTTTQAKLKAATPAQSITAKAEEHALLPDHASISFNEKPESSQEGAKVEPEPAKKKGHKATPPVISQHHTKLSSAVAGKSITLEANNAKNTEALEAPEAPVDPLKEETLSVSHTSLNFEQNSTEPVKKESQPTDTKPEISDNALSKNDDGNVRPEPVKEAEFIASNSSSTKNKVTKEETESSALGSGELHANNLLSATQKKGYEPNENQQRPTVFDTNEYHPELHDWSKLGKNQSSLWLVLLILFVFAGVLAYFFIAGVPVPVINL